ncbi:MAG: HAD hydrolase-like protein, partial [Maritimibacter sp.]|nr:HAD hydrolase-like protein [Maritimibacter sp.]
QMTQERFAGLLADFAAPDHLAERLEAAERRNLGRYGFGIKGFVLSMIETAIEVTGERVPARVIREIVEAGHAMLEHPIHLIGGAAEAIAALAPGYTLVLVTKGDLIDQERKLAQSGLGEQFDAVEIVSDKTRATYSSAFARHGTGAEAALMVGNSLKSDVIPALEAGAWGVHVPHDLTWSFEHAEPPVSHPRFARIEGLAALPALVERLA